MVPVCHTITCFARLFERFCTGSWPAKVGLEATPPGAHVFASLAPGRKDRQESGPSHDAAGHAYWYAQSVWESSGRSSLIESIKQMICQEFIRRTRKETSNHAVTRYSGSDYRLVERVGARAGPR